MPCAIWRCEENARAIGWYWFQLKVHMMENQDNNANDNNENQEKEENEAEEK